MYPLLLKAPIKDYLWGGKRLIEDFVFSCDTEKAAEAWVLSTHQSGQSIIKNGKYSGLTLNEAIEKEGQEILGENATVFPYFPILIKLIDAKDRLSLQVHPSDDYALKHEAEYGKTEMWYVIDCDEDSSIIYGLNKSVSREELSRRARDGSISQLGKLVKVKHGDVFFIEPGTLHAIGKGILMAEVQQNSNSTYRVSDYGRRDANGKLRPLHIDKALEVINPYPAKAPYGNIGELTLYPFGITRTLADSEYFKCEHLSLNGKAGMLEEKSFISLVVIDGDGTLCYSGGSMKFKKGDSIFIPANTRTTITGIAEIICTHI